jgi:hypothetical protein
MLVRKLEGGASNGYDQSVANRAVAAFFAGVGTSATHLHSDSNEPSYKKHFSVCQKNFLFSLRLMIQMPRRAGAIANVVQGGSSKNRS